LRRLQIALDQLAPRCREAFVLGRIEGLSRREIAARMGISESTVRQHLMQGMRVLADLLNGSSPDPRNPA
jgi:RNA polymerase sigma factor (sigma-70 family)